MSAKESNADPVGALAPPKHLDGSPDDPGTGTPGGEGAPPSPGRNIDDPTPEETARAAAVAADRRAVVDSSAEENSKNSEKFSTGHLCSEETKTLMNNSCTAASASPLVLQSTSEVQISENMPSASLSTDSTLPPEKCSRDTNESIQVADGKDSALESSPESLQSVGCRTTEAESSTCLLEDSSHRRSPVDASDLTDKGTRDGNQSRDMVVPSRSETAHGETIRGTADGCASKPEIVPTASTDSDEEKQSIYHVKWIKHKDATMPIITQNENGPCPLLAIMNLLLLQSKVKIPSGAEVVTSNELMAYLADWIFEHVPKNINEDTRLNYEQNMHDAIAVFPRLQTGLDVNVRFTGVSQFEYTPGCIVFDLLDIPLYHGWLVDPQMSDLVSAIGNRTYNQLVEKIIVQKNSNKEDLITEALLAEEFLNATASQLTYHGLSELSASTKEEEMCVLFRNNHFSTLYKHKNELFVLVTDQGFLRESNVVWETLSNIEGDGHFVDSEFRTYPLPEASIAPLPTPSFPINSRDQIDHDYLVALSLEQEQSDMQPGATWSGSAMLSDHELALRLQEEEDLSAESASRQQQPAPRQPNPDTPATTGSDPNASSSGGSSSSVPGKEKKDGGCSVM